MYHNQRGFGFITTADGTKYFFHITNFLKGSDKDVPVLEGKVRFDVGAAIEVGKKPQALRVQYCHKKAAAAVAKKGGTDGAQ